MFGKYQKLRSDELSNFDRLVSSLESERAVEIRKLLSNFPRVQRAKRKGRSSFLDQLMRTMQRVAALGLPYVPYLINLSERRAYCAI